MATETGCSDRLSGCRRWGRFARSVFVGTLATALGVVVAAGAVSPAQATTSAPATELDVG